MFFVYEGTNILDSHNDFWAAKYVIPLSVLYV
jgi:hypothetical protein